MRDYEYVVNHLTPAPFSSSDADDFLEKARSAFPEIAMRSSVSTIPTSTSITSRLRDMLRRLPKQLSYSKREKVRFSSAYVWGEPPREDSTAVHLFAGGIIAFSSTIVLITPIVIMTFTPSTANSLVTLSTAVLLFGFFMAVVIRAKSTEIFVATATYAAVLVVFVGTSSGSTNGSSNI
jgi:hypothetical protein